MKFDQPPELIRPLWYAVADITGWFNWDALAAIGTVGTLWFAVDQASKSVRAERVRQVATLTTLIELITPVAAITPPMPGDRLPFPDSGVSGQLMALKPTLEHALSGLGRVPVEDVARVGAMGYVNEISVTLRRVIDDIPTDLNEDANYFDIAMNLTSMDDALRSLKDTRYYITHGRLGLWRIHLFARMKAAVRRFVAGQ